MIVVVFLFCIFVLYAVFSNTDIKKDTPPTPPPTLPSVQANPAPPAKPKVASSAPAKKKDRIVITVNLDDKSPPKPEKTFNEILAPYLPKPSSSREVSEHISLKSHPETVRAYFLDWVIKRKPPIVEFPGYWLYKYGISDSGAFLNDLILQNYLKIETLKRELSDLKNNELKDILASANLPKSGKKADLVDRISSNLEYTDYADALDLQAYALTEAGWQLLEDHKIAIEIRNYGLWQLDIENYHKRPDTPAFQDFAYAELHAKLKQQAECNLWGEFRCTMYDLHKLLLKDGREDTAALYLLGVLLVDLSGLEATRQFYYKMYKSPSSAFMFAPAILRGIKRLSKYIDPSVIEAVYKMPLPFNICPQAYFSNIVNEIITNSLDAETWLSNLHLRALNFQDSPTLQLQ